MFLSLENTWMSTPIEKRINNHDLFRASDLPFNPPWPQSLFGVPGRQESRGFSYGQFQKLLCVPLTFSHSSEPWLWPTHPVPLMRCTQVIYPCRVLTPHDTMVLKNEEEYKLPLIRNPFRDKQSKGRNLSSKCELWLQKASFIVLADSKNVLKELSET